MAMLDVTPTNYDCVQRHKAIGKLVVRPSAAGELRRYYRFRSDRWYGGIFTADCSGCGLQCRFCWLSERAFCRPYQMGEYYGSVEVATRLMDGARRHRLDQVRISGGEPAIGKRHLLDLLGELKRQGCHKFILETNGILIGSEDDYAKQLSNYDFLHARVSFKGCSEDEFQLLTGAQPQGFALQFEALRRLLEAGVSCRPAVMISFSGKESFEVFQKRIEEIHPALKRELEVEEIILYPQVAKRIRQYGLEPHVSHLPGNVPNRLI